MPQSSFPCTCAAVLNKLCTSSGKHRTSTCRRSRPILVSPLPVSYTHLISYFTRQSGHCSGLPTQARQPQHPTFTGQPPVGQLCLSGVMGRHAQHVCIIIGNALASALCLENCIEIFVFQNTSTLGALPDMASTGIPVWCGIWDGAQQCFSFRWILYTVFPAAPVSPLISSTPSRTLRVAPAQP